MAAKMPMPFGNPATYRGHSGIDFAQKRGTPIRASGPGVVLRTSHNAAGGWWTVVRYDIGATFGYAHQDYRTTAVKAGDRVSEGTVIGHVGSLGKNSTGPHLHLENLYWATEAGVWGFFDRNRVVGQGNPSGGGNTKPPIPAPIPTPVDEEDDEMKNSAVYYETTKNTIVYMTFNTGSGWYSEYGNGVGNGPMPGTYNNPLAATLGTGSYALVTQSHATALKKSLDLVRLGR